MRAIYRVKSRQELNMHVQVVFLSACLQHWTVLLRLIVMKPSASVTFDCIIKSLEKKLFFNQLMFNCKHNKKLLLFLFVLSYCQVLFSLMFSVA